MNETYTVTYKFFDAGSIKTMLITSEFETERGAVAMIESCHNNGNRELVSYSDNINMALYRW